MQVSQLKIAQQEESKDLPNTEEKDALRSAAIGIPATGGAAILGHMGGAFVTGFVNQVIRSLLSECTRSWISNISERLIFGGLSTAALVYTSRASYILLSSAILGDDTVDQRSLNHEKTKNVDSFYERFQLKSKAIFGTNSLLDRVGSVASSTLYVLGASISAGVLFVSISPKASCVKCCY